MRKKITACLLSAALAVAALGTSVSGAEFADGSETVFDTETEVFPEREPETEENWENGDMGPEIEEESQEEETLDEIFAPAEEEFGDNEALAMFSSAATPTETAASVSSCRGYSKGLVRVTAKVPHPVKSVDNYYYLFQVNPSTNKLSKVVTKLEKSGKDNQTLTFKLKTAGHPEYVMSKYAVAVKTKSGSKVSSYTRISNAKYVAYPEKTASYTAAYAVPKTKKGIQSAIFSQITETKSKTAFYNLQVSEVLAGGWGQVPYKYNGKTYYFNEISHYVGLVRQCNQKGIQVTMQLMLDYTPDTKSLTASGSKGPISAYYSWNTTNTASRQKMEALFSYLAERFGTDGAYVSNWILGNEVNNVGVYNYAGNMSKAKYIENYSEAFRCLYNAVKGVRASSKVFICLDHYWNHAANSYSYASKDVMNSFAKNLKSLQADVNWNLAWHAYPFPLNDCRFWSGKNSQYLTNNENSTVISLNNLNVLTDYVKKHYGSKTRVILSEQGFTSSVGQDAQAAAISLGYYIAACNPMVDAFIIRSYADEPHEAAQGFAFGIKGKKAFKAFANMDSSKSLNYTKSYLTKQVGSKWSSKVPGYNAKKLYKTYRAE